MIAINNGSRNIWIDHNEFYNCGDKCITVWAFAQRTAGAVVAPDLITISDNVFRDSYFGILFGLGAEPGAVTGRERVTLYRNLFDRVKGRSPRAVDGSLVHFFNNVVMNWGGCLNCAATVATSSGSCGGANYGAGSSSGRNAELLAENNFYAARPGQRSCKEAIKIDNPNDGESRRPGQHGLGRVRAVGNVLGNGATVQTSEPQRVFGPSEPAQGDAHYPYELLTAEQAREYVISRAGPRKNP